MSLSCHLLMCKVGKVAVPASSSEARGVLAGNERSAGRIGSPEDGGAADLQALAGSSGSPGSITTCVGGRMYAFATGAVMAASVEAAKTSRSTGRSRFRVRIERISSQPRSTERTPK